MTDPIAAALSRASIAVPLSGRGRPGVWSGCYPVYRTLVSERGFTSAAALWWMIGEGLVKEADYSRAYQSLRLMRKHELNAAGEVGE